jgi:hypothetical protein
LAEFVLTIKQARPPLVIIMNKVVLLLVSVACGGSVAVSIRACSCKGKEANAKLLINGLHFVHINIPSNVTLLDQVITKFIAYTLRLFMLFGTQRLINSGIRNGEKSAIFTRKFNGTQCLGSKIETKMPNFAYIFLHFCKTIKFLHSACCFICSSPTHIFKKTFGKAKNCAKTNISAKTCQNFMS